ncbi:21519_t:CDS:1, partial [Dentiscutata erythropus]
NTTPTVNKRKYQQHPTDETYTLERGKEHHSDNSQPSLKRLKSGKVPTETITLTMPTMNSSHQDQQNKQTISPTVLTNNPIAENIEVKATNPETSFNNDTNLMLSPQQTKKADTQTKTSTVLVTVPDTMQIDNSHDQVNDSEPNQPINTQLETLLHRLKSTSKKQSSIKLTYSQTAANKLRFNNGKPRYYWVEEIANEIEKKKTQAFDYTT